MVLQAVQQEFCTARHLIQDASVRVLQPLTRGIGPSGHLDHLGPIRVIPWISGKDWESPGKDWERVALLSWAFPSPGDLLDPGTELTCPELQVDSLPLSHQGSPGISEKS